MAEANTLAVKIELQSPLLITRQQVGFIWEGETFIPGGVLRGAVAEAAVRSAAVAERVAALRLFDGPQAPRFNHAYAGLTLPVGVIPLTARTCKYAPGFRHGKDDSERHGMLDTLLEQLFGEYSEPVCPVCQGKMVPAEARPYMVVHGGATDWRYASPEPLFRRIGRTAVSRERGAVADRMLYTLETISTQMLRDEEDKEGLPLSANSLFYTNINLNSTAGARQWLEWLSQITHLGGARSRGLGQVAITATAVETIGLSARDWALTPEALATGMPQVSDRTVPHALNLAGRIQAFNQMAYQRSAAQSTPDRWYFTVDLQSDMLLSTTRGICYQLQAEDLGFSAGVNLERTFARYTQTGGWSAAWGLPKPTAPAWAAGSVLVFSVPTGNEALSEKVLRQCKVLEQNGWGLRREEGFGAIQICTPFHLKTEATL